MSLPNTTVDYLLKEMICSECGILFALPEWYINERIKDHKTWCCPNGHLRYYPGESDEEKLKAENEKLQRKLDWKRNEANGYLASLRATRGVVTKIKKRVEAGVCLYCKRYFPKLGSHMKSKHRSGR